MDSSAAEMVISSIAAVSVVVWVLALRYLVVSVQEKKKIDREQFAWQEAVPKNVFYGSAEVDGSAADLSRKAAAFLAEKSMRIRERTEEWIVFDSPGDFSGGQIPHWSAIRYGQVRFTAVAGTRTRIDYALALPHGRALLIWGFAFQAAGLLAIIAGFLFFHVFVIRNDDPNIRWQSVQMIQVCHFIWPPFLFGALYRRQTKFLRMEFDTFIHNLPFIKD